MNYQEITKICKEIDDKIKELYPDILEEDKFVIFRRLSLKYFNKIPWNKKNIKNQLKELEKKIK